MREKNKNIKKRIQDYNFSFELLAFHQKYVYPVFQRSLVCERSRVAGKWAVILWVLVFDGGLFSETLKENLIYQFRTSYIVLLFFSEGILPTDWSKKYETFNSICYPGPFKLQGSKSWTFNREAPGSYNTYKKQRSYHCC